MVRLNILVSLIIVGVFGFFWAIPVYALVVGSIKNLQEVMGTPVLSPPLNIDLNTVLSVFSELRDPLVNTIIVVVPVAFVSTMLGSLAAYSIYRRTGSIGDTLMLLIAISTYIPYQALLVPLVEFIKILGLYDTLPGLVLAFLIYYSPMAALLMVIFMTAIPRDMVEAALIDGAGEIRIFRRIVLPLLGPGLTSTIIFILIMVWNNFYIPLIMTRGYEKYITLKIFSYVGQSGTLYNQMFAAALIGSLPPLLIFILLGRYFIRGLLVLGTGARG
ncbi:MAG TPA: carbohydrate ABC transporter permease [Sulfolobales archaeon]|nr:carbohydrate ABC transporter permease [Sulfolobales archaeon]